MNIFKQRNDFYNRKEEYTNNQKHNQFKSYNNTYIPNKKEFEIIHHLTFY